MSNSDSMGIVQNIEKMKRKGSETVMILFLYLSIYLPTTTGHNGRTTMGLFNTIYNSSIYIALFGKLVSKET